MEHQYIDPKITAHSISDDNRPSADALSTMRQRSQQWPNVRWAVAQCVDLGSPRIGNLRFVAVGPENDIKCITSPTLTHWSYYFSGWVDLETGQIVPEVPK